jgi:hypothetical protein
MEGATEYRDTWRGLRILVPAGWRVRRLGLGIILRDDSGRRLILAQPRPGVSSLEGLELELLSWLQRVDSQAELRAEPDGPAQTRVCTTYVRTEPDVQAIGVFALQSRAAGGFISGYLAPAASYEADSRTAVEALATLQPLPALSRYVWREPSESASLAVVPRGWRVEGRIDRNHPGGMAAAGFQAWADDWTGIMASHEGKLFMEPGLLGGLLGGLAGGVVTQARHMDAAAYANAYALPLLREEVPDAQVEALIPRPDLLPQVLAREAAQNHMSPQEILQGQPTIVDAVFSFRGANALVRQLSRVVTVRVPVAMGRGLPLWTAMMPFSYRAPAERMAEWEPVLEGISQSFQVDQAWQRREQERLARQVRRPMPEVQAPADLSAFLAEAERLTQAYIGRPLLLAERSFTQWLASIPPTGEAEASLALANLYSEPIWQGVGTASS